MSRRQIMVRSGDAEYLAWQRSQALEQDRDRTSPTLVVAFRLFMNISFLGTLLQSHYGGLPLQAAVASAALMGAGCAVAWMGLTYWYGGDLPQIFIRSLMIFSLIGLWFAATLQVSPGWRAAP